jgi:hypothetical protein
VRRGFHIAVAFLAVFLLLKPFDCFASGGINQKTADCCKKGKCIPGSKSDECCKGIIPGGKQLVERKTADIAIFAIDLPPAVITFAAFVPLFVSILAEADSPPGSPPGTRLNLPLLI